MNECIKIKTNKYSFRNAPPYPANKCKSIKKKGNDGKFYVSQPDKNGTYKWINTNTNTNKNKTFKNKNKVTSEKLQMLVKKYKVTKSGSNKEIAHRLVSLRGHYIKNKIDRNIIEQFLKKSTPSTKRWGFSPATN
jgi:hypothetical protein